MTALCTPSLRAATDADYFEFRSLMWPYDTTLDQYCTQMYSNACLFAGERVGDRPPAEGTSTAYCMEIASERYVLDHVAQIIKLLGERGKSILATVPALTTMTSLCGSHTTLAEREVIIERVGFSAVNGVHVTCIDETGQWSFYAPHEWVDEHVKAQVYA